MSVVWNTTMTNLGLQLQTKQVQGATIAFTRAVSGSGSVPVVNLREQTAVSQIQQTLSMQGLTMGNLQYTIKLLLTNLNLNSGYNLSQVGLYATDPDLGEILFAIAQLSDTKPIPSKTDAPGYSLLMSLTFQNDQGANIEITPDMSGYVSMSAAQDMIDDATNPIIESLANKVDKVAGKGLSTNDFTNTDKNNLNENTSARHTHSNKSVLDDITAAYTSEEKSKLAGIAAGAEVNVQANWTQNDSSKDDYIKNKPTLGTAAAKDSTNAVTEDSTDLVESGAVFDNTQDVYEVMGKNGAKNLLPMTLANIKANNTDGTWSGNAYTHNGVVFTVNTNGSGNVLNIHVEGTPSNGSGWLSLYKDLLDIGGIILSGCPEGGNINSYTLSAFKSNPNKWYPDYGNGVTIPQDVILEQIYIEIKTGFSIPSGGLDFYPMIRLASDTDPTFQPYAKTNLQLTKELEGAKTATGNPITVTDAAPVNAVNLSMDLEPVQDLHGYDHPWVGGAGKNKLPMTVEGIKAANDAGSWEGNVYNANGVYFTILTDSDGNVTGIKVNGTASVNTGFNLLTSSYATLTSIGLISGNSYIVNGCPQGGSFSDTYSLLFNAGNTSNKYDLGSSLNLTVNSTDTYKIQVYITSGYTANNLTFYPMIRLATETDATFAPYTNICPISGRSEVAIQRVGKNKCPLLVQGAWNIDGTYSQDTDRIRTESMIDVTEGSNYIFSCANSSILYLCQFFDSNLNYVGETSWTNLGDYTSVPQNARKSTMIFRNATNTNITPSDITQPQFELGNTATTYEPYKGKTYTIQIGQTVYGCHVDATKGGLVVDTAEVDLGSLTWNLVSRNRWSTTDIVSTISSVSNSQVFNAISDRFVACSADELYNNESLIGMGENTSNHLLIRNGSTTESPTGQLVYELATSITIPLTPTQIKLLENTNTVYTDYEGDTITIEYQPNNAIGEAVRVVEESYDAELEYLKPTGSISSGDTKAVTGGVVYDYHNTTPLNPKDDLYIEKSGNVINIEARDVDGSAFTSDPSAGGYTLPTGYRPKRILIVCVYVYTTYDNKKHHGIIKIRDDGTMDGYFIDFSGNEHRIYDSSYRSEVSFNTSYIV